MTGGDWGADTLARFRYQAEVTLPYCLAVFGRSAEIVAVVPEYLEDIALQTTNGWRFLQVKSRNPERGLWKLSDLLSKKGALRSLYRTYLITAPQDYPLELILEGAIKTDDPIAALRLNQDRAHLVPIVAGRLKIKNKNAEAFLERVALDESAHSRGSIQATNRLLLHELLPSHTQPEIEAVHVALLEEIEKAMRCDRLSPFWPRAIVHPAKRSSALSEKLRFKTLDLPRLLRITGPLPGTDRPLLRRLVVTGSDPLSMLEQKLHRGGAPPNLIELARNLCANAQHYRFSKDAQRLGGDDAKIEDLHERIMTYAETANAVHESSEKPAVGVWSELLQRFDQSAGSIDQNNIVQADPMLLLGEACILSDQCRFGWGGMARGFGDAS